MLLWQSGNRRKSCEAPVLLCADAAQYKLSFTSLNGCGNTMNVVFFSAGPRARQWTNRTRQTSTVSVVVRSWHSGDKSTALTFPTKLQQFLLKHGHVQINTVVRYATTGSSRIPRERSRMPPNIPSCGFKNNHHVILETETPTTFVTKLRRDMLLKTYSFEFLYILEFQHAHSSCNWTQSNNVETPIDHVPNFWAHNM